MLKSPTSSRGSSRNNNSRRSSNYYLVLFVKILLVIIILLWLPNLVDGKRRGKKRRRRANALKNVVYRNRAECETKCLLHIQHATATALAVPEESMNCILECTSNKCYQDLYSDSPLEPGEIDLTRASQFEHCAKNELRMKR